MGAKNEEAGFIGPDSRHIQRSRYKLNDDDNGQRDNKPAKNPARPFAYIVKKIGYFN
jgi:hypothetical protein